MKKISLFAIIMPTLLSTSVFAGTIIDCKSSSGSDLVRLGRSKTASQAPIMVVTQSAVDQLNFAILDLQKDKKNNNLKVSAPTITIDRTSDDIFVMACATLTNLSF